MRLHVYDVMSPTYNPPTTRNDFQPVTLADVSGEEDKFFLKVVNQYDEDILVYLDSPPARKDEPITINGTDWMQKWESWTGPTKTMRGATQESQTSNGDPWTQRITLAPNNQPDQVSAPSMRVQADGKKLGGFYVPSGHHLRIHIATKD